MYPNLAKKIEAYPDLKEFLFSFEITDGYRTILANALLDLFEFPLESWGIPALENWGPSDLVKFVQRENWNSNQRYQVMFAVKKYLRWKFGDSHPALSAPPPRRRNLKQQRWLTAEVSQKVLASFPLGTELGIRDRALFTLALDTGFRCAELCSLKVKDVDLIARRAQVVCKGGDWGVGFFSERTGRYLEEWLDVREQLTAPGGTLFISLHRGYKGQPLTRRGMQKVFNAWGDRIGIAISPHDLRRSMAMQATLNGAPSRIVQAAGRWSTYRMLELYTRFLTGAEIADYLPMKKLEEP